jgi:hypothetical protein
MFECQRCKSSYSARHASAMANCPRCLARDKVASPLAFHPFQKIELKAPPPQRIA